MDISNISVVLGVLGAYFAILLVLSVSVETILEPFSFLKGLQKKASPDDVLRAVQEWLPEGSNEAAKAVAIETYAEKTKLDIAEINQTAKDVSTKAVQTLIDMGFESQVNTTQKEVAIKFSTLQEKYAASQKQRITILRTLSAVIGIIIAFALQINTFQILSALFSAETVQSLSGPFGQFGGIVLTGLAASAGSSFWHDMLGRVRNVKDTMQKVERVTYKDSTQ